MNMFTRQRNNKKKILYSTITALADKNTKDEHQSQGLALLRC